MLKQCKECSEFLEIDCFGINRQYKDGRESRCKSCYNARQRVRRRVPDDKLKYRRPTRSTDGISRQDKIAFIHKQKEQPCACCGETHPVCAMDFHHIDPDTKEFNLGKVTTAQGGTYTLEQIKEELQKCMLLCAICHRKIHSHILCLLPA